MTHEEMVKHAERWLLKTKGCSFCFTELHAYTRSGEIPDAIGWKNSGMISVLVECKTSRADFFSDKKKYFRRVPGCGMGDFRFIMAPRGLLHVSDFDNECFKHWGWVEVNDKGRCLQRRGPSGKNFGMKSVGWRLRKDWRNEMALMSSALRRIHIRGLLPEIYNKESRPKGG